MFADILIENIFISKNENFPRGIYEIFNSFWNIFFRKIRLIKIKCF